MSRFSIVFIFIIALTIINNANYQCIAIPVPLADRIAEAELILEGKITKIYSVWGMNKSSIYTISELKFIKYSKGK